MSSEMYVGGREKTVEGEEVKLPYYEPWEVREAKVEDKELRKMMYRTKRRQVKEADPEKSIKQETKPKQKMKKPKLDLSAGDITTIVDKAKNMWKQMMQVRKCG